MQVLGDPPSKWRPPVYVWPCPSLVPGSCHLRWPGGPPGPISASGLTATRALETLSGWSLVGRCHCRSRRGRRRSDRRPGRSSGARLRLKGVHGAEEVHVEEDEERDHEDRQDEQEDTEDKLQKEEAEESKIRGQAKSNPESCGWLCACTEARVDPEVVWGLGCSCPGGRRRRPTPCNVASSTPRAPCNPEPPAAQPSRAPRLGIVTYPLLLERLRADPAPLTVDLF